LALKGLRKIVKNFRAHFKYVSFEKKEISGAEISLKSSFSYTGPLSEAPQFVREFFS